MPTVVARAGVLAVLVFLLVAAWQLFTSPWLEWFAKPTTEPRMLLNVSRLHPEAAKKAVVDRVLTERSSVFTRLRNIPQNTSLQSVRQTARTIVIDRAPLQPVVIGHAPADTVGAIKDPSYLIATIAKDEARVGIGPTVGAAARQLRAQPEQVGHTGKNVTVAVPSFVLATLPASQYDGWNALLRERLGLIHTTPDVIGYISQFDTTTLLLRDATLAISVTGAVDAFTTTVEEWIQEDERLQRPQEQSFTLPDGSIGIETVPGEIAPVLSPIQDGCRSPLNERVGIWLCQSDQHATISNTEALATRIPDPAEEWRISISPDLIQPEVCGNPTALASTLLCQATNVYATGFNNHASVVVSLPES